MNKLLLLTIEWPYGKGETFFENEAKFCTGFDEIECMPFYKTENSRVVPKNIRIIDPMIKFYKIYYCILGIFNCFFYRELLILIKQKKFYLCNIESLVRYSMMANYRFNMLKKWLKKNDKDLEITIYTYWMASDAVAVSRLKELGYNIKLFITRCHRHDLYEYAQEGNYLPYRTLILDNVDHIAAISNDAIDYLKKRYDKKYANKYVLSRLGTLKYDINIENNLNNKVAVIVSCSNLINVKRVDLMLKALYKVYHKVKWFHFGDGILRNQLEKISKNLPPHVSFEFMGRFENKDLMKWYSKNHVDLFVNTSESEGIPVSIMEAMSFGIPVLATDVGGTSEIVKNGVNGVLINKDISSKKLAKAIDNILEDKENLYIMRRNAKETWENNFNANKNYKQFYDMLLK